MAASAADIEAIAPLTPLQSGMVFHTLREPTVGIYIVQYSCVISGALDVSRFCEAWSETVNTHAALRTVFLFEGLDEPLQVVRSNVDLNWTELNWREEDAASQGRRLDAFLSEDRALGFDLARAPLLRLALIQLADGLHRLVWTYHHAIADGWSSVLVLDEVWKRYHNPGTAAEASSGLGFIEFSHWLANQPTDAGERYWTDRLSGVDLPTSLGFTSPHGASALHDRRTHVLDRAASDALRAFATRHRLTLNTVVHGAWSVVLGACSGHPVVVYGATVAGRPSAFPGADKTVGPFISTLPMRVDTTSRHTVVGWLRELQDQLLGLREHETASVSDVARWNGVDGSDLFETLLVFENAPEAAPMGSVTDDPAAQLSVAEEQYFDQSSYAFAALVHPKDAIELHAVFRQDYVEGAAAETMLALLAETLDQLPRHADTPVAQLIGPTQAQRRALLGNLACAETSTDSDAVTENGNSRPVDVVSAIFGQARLTPDAAAVVTLSQEWSYAKLASEVHRLRELLETSGVRDGDRVGVLAPKSPEFLAGALATLAVGAAYVPLDPAYPDHRLEALLSAAGIRALLALDTNPDRLTHLGVDPRITVPMAPHNNSTEIDHVPRKIRGGSAVHDEPERAQREAYVLFTSGSTGTPKGVRVSRANLAHSTAARSTVYGTTPPRFLVLSPIGFDSSVAGLIWPLTVGGAVVLVPPNVERDPVALGKCIARLGVTMTLCVPSLYRLILEGAAPADLTTLQTVIVAGEACQPDVVDEHTRVLPGTALFNEYGPTECTVWSTFARLDVGQFERAIPIGKPIPGAVVRVIDSAGRLAPLGVAGELCVGGAGVALGYLEAIESSECFVPDLHGADGARLYRTGDRVRMMSDGVLHFLGRIDEQIKIRGFRIEPAEVEAALGMIDAVVETVVVAGRQTSSNHEQMVAYYTTRDGNPLDANELRAQLAEALPAHMVPTSYGHLEKLPRTGRGKIDRDALRERFSRSASVAQLAAPTKSFPNSTSMERELGILWRQLLGGDSDFARGDSFFDVGGDSLLAIRLLGHIRNRWNADIAMAALFDNPTLEGMGRYIEASRRLSTPLASEQTIPVRSVESALTLSLNQARLWSLTLREPDSTRFNLPFALRLRGVLNVSALRTAVNQIVVRHEVLRTRIQQTEAGPLVEVAEPQEVLQVELAPADAQSDWLFTRLQDEAESRLDLGNGECVRALLLQTAADEHVLLLVVHHLVCDGASFEIFFDELTTLYAAAVEGTAALLPSLPLQFFDVAAWQQKSGESARIQEAERFWNALFTPPPPPLALSKPSLTARALQAHVSLRPAVVDRLRSLATEEATSPYVVALAAYATMLATFTDSDDVVICTPSAGRAREETRTLIGYFNNVLPLRLPVDHELPFRDTVRATRQRVLDAQQHETLPFQRIASLPATNRVPLTRGMFTLHGTPLTLPRFVGVDVQQMEVATGTADFDVGLTILPHEGGLRCTVQYREGALGQNSGDRFLEHYVGLLDRATLNPEGTTTELADGSQLASKQCETRSTMTSKPSDEARWTQVPTEIVLAGDPLELQLTLIWEHALQIRPIAPEDNFFDLGGHSLLAVQILESIERETGVRLTLGVLLTAPTVRSLALALRTLGWRPAQGCLVQMGKGPETNPLIFLHSFEGHTFFFNELVRQFGGRVAAYGLQVVGLGGEAPLHRSVEQMAGHYLEHVEQRFGSTPVTLVGMCFGFSLCLEMAHRMTAQGTPVRLIMLDGAWDHLEPGNIIGDRAPLVIRLKRRVRRVLDQGQWILDGLRRGKTDSPHARREAAIRRRTINAWYAYEPQPYDGEITLIRAEETAENPDKHWHIDAMQSIACKALHTVIVPGHHFTILRPPYVVALANEVLKAAGVERYEGTAPSSRDVVTTLPTV